MKIAVDAFGGDNAPLEIIKGVIMARDRLGIEAALVGRGADIMAAAAENDLSLDGLEIIEAASVMDMHDDAKLVLRAKKDSSMAVGLRLVADGEADAFVSAGPTGALLMGATMIVKRIKGVKRPALGALIPASKGEYLLIDCGANAECRPEMLEQFAVMGSIYMRQVAGVADPRVGLANNGAEDTKGTQLQLDAYKLLAANRDIRFIGNVEGRDIPLGGCDVAVCDGFTGNMILKTIEGMGMAIFGMLKGILTASPLSKLAAMALRPGLRTLKRRMDVSELGGAPFIGLTRPVVKAHGNSNARAIMNAIRQAADWSRAGVTESITLAFASEESD